MRSNPTTPLTWLAAVIVLATATSGCARSKTQRLESASVSDTTLVPIPYVNPAAVPHPCPPQPSGPPIGRDDPLMNAIASMLGEWTEQWAAAQPGFSIDSTWRVGRGRWVSKFTRRFEHPRASGNEVTFDVLGLRSPDGEHTLDVDTYQVIVPEGDSLAVGGEPNSQASLIDHRTGKEAILQQCGTPCGFTWGTWLSSDTFALAGWNDADDFGQWKQGRLWIYSISDATVAEYETRIVSANDYERYLAAWNRWLLDRYRAAKRDRSRS